MKIFTKRLKQALLLLFCLGGFQLSVTAQRTVTGTVQDQETGETLVGVSIVEKENRSNGAVTDINGQFSIKVSEKSTALLLNYTGYSLLEQSIVGTNDVTIKLASSAELKEVIVIGYGTVKRQDATGLVQSVSSESFNRGAITGPQDLLAGKVAGVVITSDGSPGGGAKIRIRGESSLSASNDPLIVVDGIPLDNGGVSGSRNQLNIINPNDIESMTILKDASAAAIYGNRASGGVIIITTKKGKLGKKISVGYNMNVSAGQTTNRVDVLTADEFRQTVTTRYTDPDPTKPPHPALGLLGSANTDWQDEIYQTAFGQDHSLNVSGGIGVVPYRVSMGYTNKNGLLKTDKFSRYSTALNLSPGFINNTLQFNVNFKGMLSDNHFADRGAIGNALSFDPTKPVRDTSARFGGFTTWTIPNGNPNGLAPANPLALLELRDDNSTVKQYISSASVDYRLPFFPDLRANLNLAYDYAKGSGTIIVPNYAAFAFDAINGGGVNNVYEQTKKNSLLETYLNYQKKFGRHSVDLMGGYSWQHFEVNNSYKNTDSAGTPAETTEGRDPAEYYLISMYGRLNYGFADRYLLTASLRRDGTSRFDPDYRWGLFPAGAFAVKIIDNDKKYLNFVKLRLGVGVTGQQNIGDEYASRARYLIGQNNAQYQFGDEFITTIRPNGYVADIQWEKTATYNGGVDFSIIDKRMGGSLDIYKRNTSDLLNYIPVPALSNLTNFVTTNIGTMESKGVELTLNLTPVLTQKVKWDLSANFAYNQSEITKLTISEDPDYKGVFTGGIAGGVGSNIQIHSVGYQPSTFYVYHQLYDENGKLLEGQFEDTNGDGIVNDNDKYRYKNPSPRYTIGLTSNISLGNFDFSFAGRANMGNYVYNNVQTDMGYLNRLFGTTKYLSNVNQSAVDLHVLDQAKLTFSDHFVTKASFFRLDHVTAGYNFNHLLGKFLRVYATIQNPLVVTKYEGLDPEIGNGIDNTIYPRPRTYLLGVSVNF
jgi:TonB-linked SusC/RagA family outer membrane protein